MSSIFEKPGELKPGAMAAVAERRMADARRLLESGNAHLNGAVYLAGFVLEILLKARLVYKYSAIARKRQINLQEDEREIWNLIWRSHHLPSMLGHLSELTTSLYIQGKRDNRPYLDDLMTICAEWTIYARYSPRTISKEDASSIIERIEGLKEKLKRG